MKILLLVFVLFVSCDTDDNLIYETIEENEDLLIYPDENWGYKPALREIGDKFIIDVGNVFPNICLPNFNNLEICADDYYMAPKDMLIVSFCVKDCPPCDDMYRSMPKFVKYLEDNGYDVYFVAIVGDANVDYVKKLNNEFQLMFLFDEKKEIVIEWENDSWPEQYRGFPSMVFVDLYSMKIIADTLGFTCSDTFFEQQLNKIQIFL